jgi:hypothetical protein
MYPTRYTDRAKALRKQYGPRADKVARYFYVGDPLADAVVAWLADRRTGTDAKRIYTTALDQGLAAVPEAPAELRALFAQLEDEPLWLDPELLNLGSQTHLRCSVACGLVLGCCCLPLAYRSWAGNKPLTWTQQLLQHSVNRLTKTNWFFLDTCEPDGLKRDRQGWKTTVKIRLIHAYNRRHLLKHRRWQRGVWGVPINQVDLAATNLLFSVTVLRHLRKLGFHFSAAESEAVMHLWRYSGHLLGVAPELLCATETEGDKFLDLLLALGGPPDQDSHALLTALIEQAMPTLLGTVLGSANPPDPDDPRQQRWRARLVRFCYGLSHGLLGKRASDLNYPRTTWRYTAPLLLRSLITPLEALRRLIPGATGFVARWGQHTIKKLMKQGPVPRRPDFLPPTVGDKGQPR